MTRVQASADLLQSDIRRRGLRPGDRYLTSEEAASVLEVSTGTAHQAMRLLVDLNILERKRKQGTYIGSAVEPLPLNQRKRIYVIEPSDAVRDPAYGLHLDIVSPAISAALGGSSFQVEYLPPGDTMGFVRTLAAEAEQAGNLGAFILMRSTFELQHFFQENRHRYPTIVWGSRYPGIDKLPFVESDQLSMGTQVARYVLEAGHRRVAVLMCDHWVQGDNQLMTGMGQVFASSPQRLENFEICSLPGYGDVNRTKVAEVLSSPNRPTAIVVRTGLQTRAIVDVAKKLDLQIPADVEVIVASKDMPQLPGLMLPHFVSHMDLDRIAAMFVELCQGKQPESYANIPVEFVHAARGTPSPSGRGPG